MPSVFEVHLPLAWFLPGPVEGGLALLRHCLLTAQGESWLRPRRPWEARLLFPTQDPMFLQIWAHTVLMITSIVVKAAYDLPCAFGLHFCPAGISKENAKGDQ